jgi:long-subunit acyl-CoA synthetase (AMP-forming)
MNALVGKEVIDAVKQRIPSVQQISQAYGMTEESMCSHLPVLGMNNTSACGRLMSNYEQKIIDLETGEPLPVGKVGELCIRSPTLMLGYFNRPDATAECMDEEGFLKTGRSIVSISTKENYFCRRYRL